MIKEGEALSEWLIFQEEKPNPKTKIFTVISKTDNCPLGMIRWHPKWRHYCYFPTTTYETVYSDRCLRDISEFIKSLNWEHNQIRKRNCEI